MDHPKMKYTYVGIDSHKDSHTAVFLDCFFEKLGEIRFTNLPSDFTGFLDDALKLQAPETTLLFGMEDISHYGRTLMVFLRNQAQAVKHVNALLVARERKNRSITQKTDSVDAECAARVLLSKFSELPDAEPYDKYYILRTLVMRRGFIVHNKTSLVNHLHALLTPHYPNYRKWFPEIDSMASLAFFARYPSPATLIGTTVEELGAFLTEAALGRVGAGKRGIDKARIILDDLYDTSVPFQEIRDGAVRSTVKQIKAGLKEIQQIEAAIEKFMEQFDCTLTSMTGISVIVAAQLLSCIGDIRKFPTPAKLAQYSGIAPVTYASGKTDRQYANKRGNRELNSIFYLLAVRMIPAPRNRIVNSFFHEYYHRKISEGKTKIQALKCVQRRLVSIVWRMLTYNEEYKNPPVIDKPEEDMV